MRGYGVIVVDNLSNSNEESLRRVKTITGKEVAFYNADIRDRAAMERIFSENTFDAVIHFAGLKAVGESVQKPIEYYDNNLYGTLVLLETMKAHNVKKLVFSSSRLLRPFTARPKSSPSSRAARKRACTSIISARASATACSI